MAEICISGSADGPGALAAKEWSRLGHEVGLYAVNTERAAEALSSVPGSKHVLTGDLSSFPRFDKGC